MVLRGPQIQAVVEGAALQIPLVLLTEELEDLEL